MTGSQYFAGLDLGQSGDYTALAVLERVELVGKWDPAKYAFQKMAGLRLRYLERVPLGTPYPEIVKKVREITRSAELRGRCSLMVDATGVGRPVVDLLREADLDCAILAAVVTGGHTETHSGGYYHVPKKDLITGLQTYLQRGGLRIARGVALYESLIEEMSQMRVKVSDAGHESFGAWRAGEHDDLVFAVALAGWGAKKRSYPVVGDDGVWRFVGELGGEWKCEGSGHVPGYHGAGNRGETQGLLTSPFSR